jgi:hypothetical protein
MPDGFETCLTCGQTDNHPKLHYAEETYHNDCLPPRVAMDVRSGGDGDKVVQIIEKCQSGLKGDDLRNFIIETF